MSNGIAPFTITRVSQLEPWEKARISWLINKMERKVDPAFLIFPPKYFSLSFFLCVLSRTMLDLRRSLPFVLTSNNHVVVGGTEAPTVGAEGCFWVMDLTWAGQWCRWLPRLYLSRERNTSWRFSQSCHRSWVFTNQVWLSNLLLDVFDLTISNWEFMLCLNWKIFPPALF